MLIALVLSFVVEAENFSGTTSPNSLSFLGKRDKFTIYKRRPRKNAALEKTPPSKKRRPRSAKNVVNAPA